MSECETYVERVQLPPLLDEFRSALLEEIAAAQRNEINNVIQLSNGYKVGQKGGMHQYVFIIDSIINAPSDSPADLLIPGKATIQATIVSVEGLSVLISIEMDIGKYVGSANLRTNMTMLLKKLIKRIEDNAGSSNPLESRMLSKNCSIDGAPHKILENTGLNSNQLCALESALGRNLTVIQGPPGTGKTHTIGTIAKHLYSRDRTVLIVSHTNIAIDQAIKHVAKHLEHDLKDGKVIRIGEVRDQELETKYEEVLLEKQKELQSKDNIEKRDALKKRVEEYENEHNELDKKIQIIDWLSEAQEVINQLNSKNNEIRRLIADKESKKKLLTELSTNYVELKQLHKDSLKAINIKDRLNEIIKEEIELRRIIENNMRRLENLNDSLEIQKEKLRVLKRIQPLRNELANYSSADEQLSTVNRIVVRKQNTEMIINDLRVKLTDEQAVLEKSKKSNVFSRFLKNLPKPDEQELVVKKIKEEVLKHTEELNAINDAYNNALKKHSRIIELCEELSSYQHIDTFDIESERLGKLFSQINETKDHIKEGKINLDKILQNTSNLNSTYMQYATMFTCAPETAINQVSKQLEKIEALPVEISNLENQINKRTQELSDDANQQIEFIEKIEGIASNNITFDDKIKYLEISYKEIFQNYSHLQKHEIQERVKVIKKEISNLDIEISAIDSLLLEVEKSIIMNARILGATLTKTYLSDDIQSRKFDTVILDEASMAPIPALWAASLLCENNLVIVGDNKQLPPIVISDKKYAREWLGKDILEKAGLKDAWEDADSSPDYYIRLTEQRRMLPEIMDVVNRFYNEKLEMSEDFSVDDTYLHWYKAPPYDNPVTLIDTGSLNAWVTSVVRGHKSSRLNFLSAIISVDFAEQLLNQDELQNEVAKNTLNKILIISPYNPHAKLVNVLINENKAINQEVKAGTVHSFQGSEADVVIFDLVVDEPHFKVNLFIPILDDAMKALLNVGLSRAKTRLYIIGDFDYCLECGRNSFLGRELLPFLLKKYQRVNASSIFPNGLAAKVLNPA